jgi:hypothetical protein
MICSCPLGAALPTVAHEACQENFGQVGMLVFQRLSATALTTTTAADIATWTPLLSELDDEKIQVTPKLHNVNIEGGDPRTARGGNASLGGVPITLGSNPTTMTGEILTTSQATIADLKQIACEKDLGVWIVNAAGWVAGRDTAGDGTNFVPFSIADDSLIFTDKKFGGYEDVDMNMFSFSMVEGWSDDFKMVNVVGDMYSLIQ